MGPFSTSGSLTKLAQLLPTGTFLTFQTVAPLFTNNGSCGTTEKILTGVLLLFFLLLCFSLSFIDSITTTSGKVYYGILTRRGLYNPQFKTLKIPGDLKEGDNYFTGGEDNDHYLVHTTDFINGVLNVVTFGVLSGLTAPVTTCYYPDLPKIVVDMVPVLIAIIVGFFFSFFSTGRRGVGFALSASGFGFVQEETDDTENNLTGKPPTKAENTAPATPATVSTAPAKATENAAPAKAAENTAPTKAAENTGPGKSPKAEDTTPAKPNSTLGKPDTAPAKPSKVEISSIDGKSEDLPKTSTNV